MKILALLLLLLLPALGLADTLSGLVVKVVDGDTIHVLDADRERHKIRLSGIDAPESDQPYGKQAQENLWEILGNEEVTVEWDKRDRHERILGKVMYRGIDANLEMVEDGYAWWYRKYADEQSADDQRAYEEAEDSAKAAGVGLWADPDPVAPWEWRRR